MVGLNPVANPPSPPWLERANRLAIIARLLSSTVHDVNNALQVIGGSAELLQMAPGASEAVLRRGQAIGTQAKRASTLLNELTEFVKDGRSQPERVGLKKLGAQAMAMRQYNLTKLRVTTASEGDEVFVDASPKQLLQIALNLVLAAEASLADTPDGRLVITTAHEGDRATMSLETTGRPIAAADFEPNFSAESAGHELGLGVGLHVSQWLAGQWGGSLTAAGSRTILALPASRG